MATIKAYTDIEQSKKLAKFLPIESADMWHHGFFNPRRMSKIEYNPPAPYHSVTHQWDCPCWSLAALLSILPKGTNISTPDPLNKIRYSCWNDYDIAYADNPVDACVAMIEELHELNLL